MDIAAIFAAREQRGRPRRRRGHARRRDHRRAPRPRSSGSGSGSTTRRPSHEAMSLRRPSTTSDVLGRRATEPNIVMLHYNDLQADLEGEMRRSRCALGIDGCRGPLARAGRRRRASSNMRDRADDDRARHDATHLERQPAVLQPRHAAGSGDDLLDDARPRPLRPAGRRARAGPTSRRGRTRAPAVAADYSGLVEPVDQLAQPRVGAAVEPHAQARQLGDVVVGDLGLARGRRLDAAAREDVGELRRSSRRSAPGRKALHAQDEVAVDEAQRVVVAVEAGDLGAARPRRRR